MSVPPRETSLLEGMNDFTLEQIELIDRKTVSVHFEMVSSAVSQQFGADQLFVTGQNGNTKSVSFPGYAVILMFAS